MALPSWTDLDKFALQASRKKKISPVARTFLKTLHKKLFDEKKIKRSPGDKQGLVSCIKAAMQTIIDAVTDEFTDAENINKYRIKVPGLPRGKFPDYAIRRGKKIYLIEQKSILRFNEFSQVFFEALIAKKNNPKENVRFVGLFNYLHQERQAFENLCTFNKERVVDRLFVLIPDISYKTGYDPHEIELLHKDIVEWLH